MNNQEIKEIIMSGCKFRYISYDHKKALVDYRENYNPSLGNNGTEYKNPTPSCYYMPQQYKDKYRVERVGKLRAIFFNPIGEICKVKIGNKYTKSFYPSDFGVSVFPLNCT